MVRQDLVNYIKQYAAQGYTIDTLRNFLLQQGYPSQDVDEAIQAVKQKKLPLVKIGFVLGGVIILLIIILLIFGLTREAPPEIEMPAPPPEVAPPLPEVPSPLPEVPLPTEVAPPAAPAPLAVECPSTCNDYNICTRDFCSEGKCVFEELVPCCGNRQCEAGETEDSCPDDCARERFIQPEATQSIVQQAEAIAPTNPTKATQLCQSIQQTVATDNCLKSVASLAKDQNICTAIYSLKKKDECHMNHAIDQEDFSVCPSINDRWLRNSCLQYGRLRKIQASLPET